MVVITLVNCPESLRGDLTKWLMEIDAGVFVGRVGARIRERLWERISGHIGEGRALMVFSAANEQRLDFRVVNGDWTPVDFDGLRLMLRPERGLAGLPGAASSGPGFSKARQRLLARRRTASSRGRKAAGRDSREEMSSYAVMDFETTGLSPDKDEIIEMSALLIRDGEAAGSYAALVRIGAEVPAKITEITGITGEMLRSEGRELRVVLEEFLAFVGTGPLVAHNAAFDLAFLNAACRRSGLPAPGNRCVDTLPLAKRLVRDLRSYGLRSLAEHLRIAAPPEAHRGLADCAVTRLLYEKLMKFD